MLLSICSIFVSTIIYLSGAYTCTLCFFSQFVVAFALLDAICNVAERLKDEVRNPNSTNRLDNWLTFFIKKKTKTGNEAWTVPR